jgi:hypothetical protein
LELSQAGLSTRQIAKLLEEEFGEKVGKSTIAFWLKQHSVQKFTQVKNWTPPDNNPQSPANNPTPNPNHLDRDKKIAVECYQVI